MKNSKIVKQGLILITYAIILYFIFTNFEYVLNLFSNVYIILAPFVYGFILAYLLNKPFVFFREKVFAKLQKSKNKKIKKLIVPLSLVSTYACAFGAFTILMIFVIPQLFSSVNQLINNFPHYIVSMQNIADELTQKFGLQENIFDTCYNWIINFMGDFHQLLNAVFPHLFNFTKSFTSGIYNWTIGIIVSMYYLGNKDKLLNQINKIVYAVIPTKKIDGFFKVATLANSKFGQFIIGKLLDSLVIGILCFIGMTIFNMPYAILISTIVGVTNIIPFFGPFIGAIPSIFILLIIDPIKAFWFAIFILILQQLDGNVIGPKIIGGSIGISGIWIMFSVIIGGGLFGVVGMIVGVPVFAILYTLTSESIHKKIREKGINKFEVENSNDEN